MKDEDLPETENTSPSLPVIDTTGADVPGPVVAPFGPTVTNVLGPGELPELPSGIAVDLANASPPPRKVTWPSEPVQYCLSPNGADVPVSLFAAAPPSAASKSILHQPKRGNSGAASSNCPGLSTVFGAPPRRATSFAGSQAVKKRRDSDEEVSTDSVGIITKVKRRTKTPPDEPEGVSPRQDKISSKGKKAPEAGPEKPGGDGDPPENKGGKKEEEKGQY